MNILSRPSPNYDARPERTIIDTVVLHATVLESLQEVIDHFANPMTEVSAHYTIDRDGTVASHVPELERAWHAGASRLPDGRTVVNSFSIGIELINRNDGIDPFPPLQIQALRALLEQIIARHPVRQIVTHREIAEPPGRKTDPAGFDMACIADLLK